MMVYSDIETELMMDFLKLNFPTKRIKSKIQSRVSKKWETVIVISDGTAMSVTDREKKEAVLNYLVSDLRKVFASDTNTCYPIAKSFLNI